MSCLYNVKSKELIIPKEAIRLRVLANSNSDYDQKIKMKVSAELQTELYNLLKDTKNIEEARLLVKNNINLLNIKIGDILKQENYNKEYKITFGNNYFPEKKYKGTVYEEGYYESLLVTLGEGEGNNWWCVLFPPLCLMEAEETEKDEVEYKFFIQELLDKYL
jgi:stage II sporulation protein R